MTTAGRPEAVDVATLRKVAEAATPGPWRKLRGSNGEQVVANATVIARMQGQDERANMRHIATFDPPTVLALLDEITALTARLAAIEAVALPGTLAAMRQIAGDAAAVVRGLAPRE